MGLFRNRSVRRSGRLGLLSDLILLGSAGAKLMRKQRGAPGGGGTSLRRGEMMLMAGAVLRLARRVRGGRKKRKLSRSGVDAG